MPPHHIEKLKKDWHKFTRRSEINKPNVISAIDDAETFWIKALSSHTEGMREKIAGMKKPKSKKKSNSFPAQRKRIYNRAINDVLALLDNHKAQ